MTESTTRTRRVAFLTMDDTAGWSIDADLAFRPLADLGWQAEWLPWRSPGIDWDAWDAVYLAATWDYPDDPEAFVELLGRIDRSNAVLVNALGIVRWNIPKTYLRDLERGGVPIVPSHWFERFDQCDLSAEFDSLDVDRLIVKPVISTNAKDTFLLDRSSLPEATAALRRTFADRAFIVQAFMAEVQTEGEYSLFYIGDGFSHAIRKIPEAADFRVQEEHGATIEVARLTPELLSAGEKAVSMVRPQPLYARCDFVRDKDGLLRVMELELIEPSLYLRMHHAAPSRFAAAFDQYVTERGKSG